MIAIVPVKSFHRAKSRVRSLTAWERKTMAGQLFHSVFRALKKSSCMSRIIVVGPSEIETSVKREGGEFIREVEHDLNKALHFALTHLPVDIPRFLIMADLPFLTADDIRQSVQTTTDLTFFPAANGWGTNGVIVASGVYWDPCFEGKESLNRHINMAIKRGLSFSIREIPGFFLDIDTDEDLTYAKELGWKPLGGRALV